MYVLLLENHLLPVFGQHKEEIKEKEVQQFILQKLSEGLSQKSIKDIVIILNMILKFGAKNKWIHYSAFDLKYPTYQPQKSIEIMNKSYQKKIMNYIKEHFTFRNLGIYICLCTGMRIGEICALTWEDIDTQEGVICIRSTIQRIYVIDNEKRYTKIVLDTPKTKNSIREIPINKDLLQILKPLKKIVNPSFFVLTNDKKYIEPRTYRNFYKRLMTHLDIPPIKFHGLRHSFATRCIESKCDYKTVSVLLGHANISTTLNLYVHPNMEKRELLSKWSKG